MVLLDLLEGLTDELRPQLTVAHVNHELRRQSTKEEAFIRQYCRRHHLPLVVKHWPRESHPTHGVEEAARRVRYDFFAEVMKKRQIGYLVTAHHENDLAETMLMKLVRGGQLHQLIGINDHRPFANGQLVRPLLPFTKAELISYAKARHLTWYTDETNNDLTITRNRYRHQIIPTLEKENPQVLAHLQSYHQQLIDVLAIQTRWEDEQLVQLVKADRFQLGPLLTYPYSQQKMLVQRWLEKEGVRDLKMRVIDELVAVLANVQLPQAHLPLPGDWDLIKDYGAFWLENIDNFKQKAQKWGKHVVKLGQRYPVGCQRYLVVEQSAGYPNNSLQEMWLAPDQLPLTIRRWQAADRLVLKGGNHQKVARVLVDQKVPTADRNRQLVLVDAHGEIVWVIGRKWSWFDRPVGYQQEWRRLLIGIVEGGKHE